MSSDTSCSVNTTLPADRDQPIYAWGYQFATAMVSANVYIPTDRILSLNPRPIITSPYTYQIGIDLSARAINSGVGISQANVTYTDTFLTTGPVRPGYIVPYDSFSYGRDNGVTFATVTLSSQSEIVAQYTYGPGSSPGTSYRPAIPVSLGTPYTLTIILIAMPDSRLYDGSFDDLDLSTKFAFVETDRSTVAPLVTTATPEPTTFLLAALPLAALALRRRLTR